jgi:tetratricopeptide (TPR) repeat protein
VTPGPGRSRGASEEARGPLAEEGGAIAWAGGNGRLTPGLTPDDEERLALAVRRPSRVDGRVIASLTLILAEQRAAEDVIGSARLLPPVRTQVAELERLAAGTRSRFRDRLLAVGAQWAQFAGWLAISTELFPEARSWLDRAAEWSAEIGDANLYANALSFKGHLAFQLGDLAAVIGLSQAAVRDQRVWVGQRAYDAHQEARAHAVAGDVADAVAKLGEAADLSAAVEDDEGGAPPWQYYYTPPFYALERGLVHRYLGRHDPAHNERAIASFTVGLDGLGESRGSEWAAESACQLAVAYLQAGAPDRACVVAGEAAAVAHATGSTRLRSILGRLHGRLAERWPNHPAVVDLNEILRG